MSRRKKPSPPKIIAPKPIGVASVDPAEYKRQMEITPNAIACSKCGSLSDGDTCVQCGTPLRAETGDRPPTDFPAITETQSRYLVAIDEMIRQSSVWQAPSLRRLGAHLGVSVSTAHTMVEKLKDAALITCDPYHSTSYQISDRGRTVLERLSDNDQKSD